MLDFQQQASQHVESRDPNRIVVHLVLISGFQEHAHAFDQLDPVAEDGIAVGLFKDNAIARYRRHPISFNVITGRIEDFDGPAGE